MPKKNEKYPHLLIFQYHNKIRNVIIQNQNLYFDTFMLIG